MTVLDDPSIQDSMAAGWETARVAARIAEHAIGVDKIITFDQYGVSGHINHCACYHAVKHLVRSEGYEALALRSVTVPWKYSGWCCFLLDRILADTAKEHLFVIQPQRMVTEVLGSVQQHKSQLVWYRYLYVAFSRYTMVNTMTDIQ